MNGRRALGDKGVYLFPDVLRVPPAIKMPGVKPHTVEVPVSHLDLAPMLLEVAGVEALERLDGRSLMPCLRGTATRGDCELLIDCGWHVGVNFPCAIQRWVPGGAHHLYIYNLSSTVDELYDLNTVDAENLAGDRALHKEMVAGMGAFLARDPRWIGYWHSFRIDHYFDLPKPTGDVQMLRPV